MPYRLLADVTMTVHFLFLAFLLLGGFLAWRWHRVWFAHAAVAVYGLANAAWGFVCPLTPLEQEFRLRAGQDGLEPTGFIDTYIEGVIYPEELTMQARWATAVVIAVSWAGLLLIRRGRLGSAPAQPTAEERERD